MKNFKNIVLDSIPPENRNDLWLHQIDADDGQYELKVFATIKKDNSVSPFQKRYNLKIMILQNVPGFHILSMKPLNCLIAI